MKREKPNSPKDVGGHRKDRTDYSISVGFKTMLKYNTFCHILFRGGTIFLFIFLLLIQSVKCETQMDKRSVASIGSAKMEEDGTIVLRLRAETPGGRIWDHSCPN
jgi:hypothetical protein